MTKQTVFLASFPPTATAFKAHGDEGFRITLDLAESESEAAIVLMGMRRKLLRVTVEEVSEGDGINE